MLTALVTSCGQGLTGYQGGKIPTDFDGISSAIAVSPQTIRLTWNAYPGSNKYNVYTPDSNSAIAQPIFNTYLFKPVPLDVTRTYYYSVSAVDPISASEVGNRAAYVPVKLLEHFNFQQSGAVTAISKTAILVSWAGKPTVNYRVYISEKDATGRVNYNNFVATTIPAVDGGSSAVITGLAEGHEYCAIVAASYLDSTNDSPNGNLVMGDVGAAMASDDYMKGPSGNFSDSIISLSQKCARTVSDFDVSTIDVFAQQATFSSKPMFFVNVPADTSLDNQGDVKTEIYQMNEQTLYSSMVGSTTGSGIVTTLTSIPPGKYKYFALATDMRPSGVHAQAVIEIKVGPTSPKPSGPGQRRYVYVRAHETNENINSPTGYYPEKQQGGLGSQRLGSAVAMGDFNCDGKKDIAVGIPNASVMANDNRPAQLGKVVVYYDVNSGTPTSSERYQEITFDITSFAGDVGRNLRLGTKLYVGNFNGDNQQSNQFGGANENPLFSCDDLIIGSGYGPMFYLSGKRDVGTVLNPHGVSIPDGGLNYVNSTSFTRNPSTACDPTSNLCQPSVYTTNSNSNVVGFALTSGDYNGDNYEDLAASGIFATVPGNAYTSPLGTWVFRGSEYGLISPNSFVLGNDSVTTTPGPYPGFPFIPIDKIRHAYNATYYPTYPVVTATPVPTPSGEWGGQNFGRSITTWHNAYYDNQSPAVGTKRVRDILLIGNPLNNSMNACIPKTNYDISQPTFADDPNTNLYWDCSKDILGPSGSNGIGYSAVDIKNALRYRPDEFQDLTTNPVCSSGNANCSDTSILLGFPSAVALGDSSAGKVYMYYTVAKPTNGAWTTRDERGAALNAYVNGMFNNAGLTVVANNPCTVTAGLENCNVQVLSHPTSSAGAFGSVVNALSGNVVTSNSLAKDTMLAVAAPYKSFVASGGVTYFNVGSVQLYNQNSRFENNPIIVTGTCGTTDLCRYSDGFSNTLTTALDYDGPYMSNVYFGLGGVASGPLEPLVDNSNYASNSDIVVGGPGYVVTTTGANNQATQVIDNGGVFAYFSHGGTYRTFRISESGPTASPWHIMSKSYAQESDYKYNHAVPVGDLNFDGFTDVAVRINRGFSNEYRIYNGSSNKVGVDTAAGTYTKFAVQGDASGGMRFFPAGKVGNGQFPFYFVTGSNASYLFASGISGILQGVPTNIGVGGTPRMFSAPKNIYVPVHAFYMPYLDLSDASIYNPEVAGNIDSTLNGLTPLATGDFNGDGFQDMAVGLNSTLSIYDTNNESTGACANAGTYKVCGSGNNIGTGRIAILYGGADNGFQVQADSNGGIPLSYSYVSDYSADSGSTTGGNACNPTTGSNCKLQLIHEDYTASIGTTLASIPIGYCTIGSNQVPVNALLATVVRGITGPNANKTDIYVYKPACLGTAGDLSGLKSYAGEKTLTVPSSSRNSNTTLGLSMTPVKGIMGSSTPTSPINVLGHMVVTDQLNRKILVYPVHDFNIADSTNFQAYDNVSPSTNTFYALGGREIAFGTSVMVGGATGAAIGFGNGVSSAGDINGDGYTDVAVAMTALNRQEINTSTASQGAIVMFFGGATGLQTHIDGTYATIIEPSRTATCYLRPTGNSVSSICNPSLIYLPQPQYATPSRNGAYERIFLSPNARMEFGSINDGLGTILIGSPGRDSIDPDPSKRILQGGVFYVQP